jgi:hypothetical protein
VRFEPRYGIIPLFSRLYYPALLPMVGLMAVAIGRRVSDYGITEKRYIVMAACVGLAWVSCDQVWKRSRSMR